MMSIGLLLQVVFWLCVAGIALTLLVPEIWCPKVLAWVGSAVSLAVLWNSGKVLLTGDVFQIPLWTLPAVGTLSVSLDRLSALFLVVTALVFLPASIFSSTYLPRYLSHYSLKAFNVWYLALFASIVVILIAGDALLFLMAWEAMSILSYLLVLPSLRSGRTRR